MNILLTIGLLLIIGYMLGLFLYELGLPKIIGYIVTGIIFSPNTIDFVEYDVVLATEPLLEGCLAVIGFEVGGFLKW